MNSTITLHPKQSEIFSEIFLKDIVQNIVAVTSRGWGKSFLAATCATNAIFELMQLDESVPNKNVLIIAPTYTQVSEIYFPLLIYELGLSGYCLKYSRDAGRLWFPKNVELKLISFEAIERLRGSGAYYVVNDEIRDWAKTPGAKEAWESIIQPTIVTRWSPKQAKQYGSPRSGRSLTISTPKGYDYLYEMFTFQDTDVTWKSYQLDYTTSPLLDPVEIERIRHNIDPIRFAREYLASFQESGNNVFYCFDRKLHIRNDLEWFKMNDEGDIIEDIHIGIDLLVDIKFGELRG